MSDDRIVYKLQFPIRIGDEEPITEFRMRRLKAKDIKGIPSSLSDQERGLRVLSRLSGQPDHVIDELDGVDLAALGDIVDGFFPTGPKTGTKRSR